MQKISVNPVVYFTHTGPSTPQRLVEDLYYNATRVFDLWNSLAVHVTSGCDLPENFVCDAEAICKVLFLVRPGSDLHRMYATSRSLSSDHLWYRNYSERVIHAFFYHTALMLRSIIKHGPDDPGYWHSISLCEPKWLCDELANERMAMLEFLKTGKPSLLPLRDETPRQLMTNAEELLAVSAGKQNYGNVLEGGKRIGSKASPKGSQSTKLETYLAMHHQYENGRVGNYHPAESVDIARELKVSKSTVSDFLKREFLCSNSTPRTGYVRACKNRGLLLHWFMVKFGDHLPQSTGDIDVFDEAGIRELH
jgi:hypothetical protein